METRTSSGRRAETQTKHAGDTYIQEATRTREEAQEILEAYGTRRQWGILRLETQQCQPRRGMRNKQELLTITWKRQPMSHAARLGSTVTPTPS
jgi:hypothetical protein